MLSKTSARSSSRRVNKHSRTPISAQVLLCLGTDHAHDCHAQLSECVRSTPGRDLPTLEAENKELRERLAKVDAEMAEIKYARLSLGSTLSHLHAERHFLRSRNSRASWQSRVSCFPPPVLPRCVLF